MYKQHECIVVEQTHVSTGVYCWANMYKQQECVVDVVGTNDDYLILFVYFKYTYMCILSEGIILINGCQVVW